MQSTVSGAPPVAPRLSGSIAAVDEIGLLKVGPRSAGSQPGPASYGLGGTEPTVTDANLVLGYLNPAYFAGGEVRVDMDAARATVERLAARLALEPVTGRTHQLRVHCAAMGWPIEASGLTRLLGLTRDEGSVGRPGLGVPGRG